MSTVNTNSRRNGLSPSPKSKESSSKLKKNENPCLIGLTGDLHYHTWASFSTETEFGQSRLVNLAATMHSLLIAMAEAGCETIVLLGDIFHKRGTISVESLHAFANFVARAAHLDIALKIIVGNHDMDRRDNTVHALEVFKSVDHVTVYDTVCIDTVTDASSKSALYIPYHDDHEVIQKTLDTLGDGPDYIFGHFGVANAKLINTDFVIDKGVNLTNFTSKTVKGVFLGHYHTPQKLDCPIPAYYVGSPLAHTFNDEGVIKQASILDISNSQVSKILTKYLEFVTVNASKNEDIARQVYKPAYYRVKLNGFTLDQKVAKAAAKTAYPGGIEFVPVKGTDQSDQVAKDKNLDVNSVVSSYVKTLNTVNKSEIYKIVSEILKETL